MPAGGAITRAEIAAMSLDEFAEREDEILRWTRGGADDGEVAPPGPKRPAEHAFTLTEVQGLSTEEFAQNEAAILRQLPTLGQEAAAQKRTARARAGR